MKPTIQSVPKAEFTTKIWGQTKCLLRTPLIEVHELNVKEGGHCSRHRHKKWNHFSVLEGILVVELFEEVDSDSASNDLTLSEDGKLEAGDHFRVAPGVWHRFRAEEDCHVLEMYWMPDVDPGDIDRADEGFLQAVNWPAVLPDAEKESKPEGVD